MLLLDLLPPISEAFTVFIVNKAERGNTLVLMPMALALCWAYQARLQYRKRKWMRLSANEQLWRQHVANKQGRRNEPYPL